MREPNTSEFKRLLLQIPTLVCCLCHQGMAHRFMADVEPVKSNRGPVYICEECSELTIVDLAAAGITVGLEADESDQFYEPIP